MLVIHFLTISLAVANLTAFDRFWGLVSGVLLLNSETFTLLNRLPLGLIASILVVLLAGLSQTFGQSVMLFINRVRPLRFILSVAIAAVIFVFNYNFWILSTWLVARWLFGVDLPLIIGLWTKLNRIREEQSRTKPKRKGQV